MVCGIAGEGAAQVLTIRSSPEKASLLWVAKEVERYVFEPVGPMFMAFVPSKFFFLALRNNFRRHGFAKRSSLFI